MYNLTRYVDDHPGGDALLRGAGMDWTEKFHGPQHPAHVFTTVRKYQIGTVVPIATFSRADVAKHCTREDAWIIVGDRVYDITRFVSEHPGGDTLMQHAGGDATDAFNGPQHLDIESVRAMASRLWIGAVAQ